MSKTKDLAFERTRFRCVPTDRGEKQHVYLGPMPARRTHSSGHVECPSCERPFQRAEGLAGGYRFRFVVREIALALTKVGEGHSYRRVSRDLRRILGRVSVRGRRRGLTSKNGHLAINYIDLLGAKVIEELAPQEWPAIVLLDALPLRIRDHSLCCAPYRALGLKPPQHTDSWGPPEEEDVEERDVAGVVRKVRRPKVPHAAPIFEIGRILVAVGLRHAGDPEPKPILIRYAGGGDQASWSEFLRALPGQPEWVVSDRDGAIITAVEDVWHNSVHYFCEQHIADNGSEKATADGIDGADRSFWTIFEQAQYGPEEWLRLRDLATGLGLPTLLAWMIDNEPTMAGQWAKRRQFYPRSASACETVIRRIGSVVGGREPFFRNADRLNLMLGLARLEIDGSGSINAYSTTIRDAFAANDGRSSGAWFDLRDPAGTSSMRDLVVDSVAKAKAAKTRRHAPRRAANHRRRRAEYEAERKALGLAPAPRGMPRLLRAQGSVAGKTIADFGWLVAEFHESLNGTTLPRDVPAGSGEMIWWRCFAGLDHEWQAQTRSRTMRGSGCPFCAHKRVANSEALATTHPDIAAQWHPTRNGEKTPADFTYGSHHEAWWQCSVYKTHVWRARIASRTSMLSGCSLCNRLKNSGGKVRKDAEDNAVA